MGNGNRDGRRAFRAKITGRHAITLPAELCRTPDLHIGDAVEFEVVDDRAVLKRATVPATPTARGMLRGYFSSWDDINRYVAEERAGWDDREARLNNREDGPNRDASS